MFAGENPRKQKEDVPGTKNGTSDLESESLLFFGVCLFGDYLDIAF